MDWSVEIEAIMPAGEDREDLADRVIDLLEGHGPAVSFVDGHVSVRFDVDQGRIPAESPYEAFVLAKAQFEHLLPDLVAVRVEVNRVEDLLAELERPNAPELVGVAEVAELLGVSKTRVHELSDKAAFPEPVARLAAGPVWSRPAVARFIESWNRRPGRPRRPTPVPA